MMRLLTHVVLLVVAACCSAPWATADATTIGSFDTSWGERGAGVLPTHGAWKSLDVTETGDGGAFVIEDGNQNDVYSVPADHILDVTRLTPAGYPDPTWGTAGLATVELSGVIVGSVSAIDPRGRLVVAGSLRNRDDSRRTFLVRFTTGGAVDTQFGGGLQAPGFVDVDSIIATTSHVIIGGQLEVSALPGIRWLDVSTGIADPTRGAGGTTTLGEAPGTVTSLAVDEAGRVVTALRLLGNWYRQTRLVRVDSSGKTDPSFASALPTYDAFSVYALRSSGDSLTVGGTREIPRTDARYLPPVFMGYTFDSRGHHELDAPRVNLEVAPYVASVVVRPRSDGLVLAGTSLGSGTTVAALMAIGTDGALDARWAGTGFVRPAVGTGEAGGTPTGSVIVPVAGVVRRIHAAGRIDTGPPRLDIVAPGCNAEHICVDPRDNTAGLTWRASDDSPGVVVQRVHGDRSGFVGDGALALAQTSAECAFLRAVDLVGQSSGWTHRCRASFGSATAMTFGRGWSTVRDRAAAGGNVRVTRSRHATLRIRPQLARSVFLRVMTCPSCGRLEVRIPGRPATIVNLRRVRTTRFDLVRLTPSTRTPVSVRTRGIGTVRIDGVAYGPQRMPSCPNPFQRLTSQHSNVSCQ